MPPARHSKFLQSPVLHFWCAVGCGLLEIVVLIGILWCMVEQYGRPYAWARGFGLIALYVVVAMLMVRFRRTARLGRPPPPWPSCANCRYSLRGLDEVDRCPECGAAISHLPEDRAFTTLPRMTPER